MEEGSFTYTKAKKEKKKEEALKVRKIIKQKSLGEFLIERTSCLLKLACTIYADKIEELTLAEK